MKRLNYLFACFIIGGLIFTSACTEEETIDKTAVLMDTLWDISVLNIEASNAFTTETYDVIANMEPCSQDDLLDFVSTTEYNILDAGTSCGTVPVDGILFTGSWNLNNEANTLELDAGYFEQITAGENLIISISDLATDGMIIFDIVTLNQEKVVLELTKVVPVTDPNSGFSIDNDLTINATLLPAP